MLVFLLLLLLLLILNYSVKSLNYCNSFQLIYIRDNYLTIRNYHHHHHNHYNDNDNNNNRENIIHNYTNTNSNNNNNNNYCNITNSYDGQWCYLSDKRISVGYPHCPKLMGNLTFPNDKNVKKYSSGNITVGYFVPSSLCKYISIIDSISIIDNKLQNKSIIFIGDSLGGHQYTCLSCEIEFISRKFHLPIRTEIKYHYDVTLRTDEPCHPACINNATFLHEQINKFPNSCIVCPDGKKPESNSSHPFHWKWAVDEDNTGIIIFNGGAWYSPIFGFGESIKGTKKYEETLLQIIPIIRSYIEKGIIVIWFCLPPSNPKFKEYAWDEFYNRNEIAKNLLEPEKVIIYNPNNATYSRYITDPSASVDLLHWRGPGITTIPSFISRTLLHTIAKHILHDNR